MTGGIVPLDTKAEGSIIAAEGINSTFTIQAKQTDEKYNNTEILVVSDITGPKVSYDTQSKQITIGIDPNNPPTAAQIVELINSDPEMNKLFSASIPPLVEGTTIAPNGSGLVKVGDSGMLQTKTTGAAMGAAMLGATDNASLGIMFHSVEYGSKEFVDGWATNGNKFAVTDRFGTTAERAYGTDVVADINGRQAIGEGRIAKSATSDLEIEVSTDPAVLAGDVFGFRISGGGALMQLGPDALWSQQVRVSIQSIHSTALGGESGTLSQLKTDEQFSLLKDTKTAFRIVKESEVQLTSMRGLLGALQKTRIDTSIDNMKDAAIIGEEARSNIADVEFASATSELSRQQLLMQSAIAVLQQSGQTKQLLLSLLQG
jgi:flagellin-like hook-associated protein FlgL